MASQTPSAFASVIGFAVPFQLLKVPLTVGVVKPVTDDMSTEKVTLKAIELETIPNEMIKRASSFFNISLILGLANIY